MIISIEYERIFFEFFKKNSKYFSENAIVNQENYIIKI